MFCSLSIRNRFLLRAISAFRGSHRPLALLVCGSLFLGAAARAQSGEEVWQTEVRKYADAHDYSSALRIVDQQIALSPGDLDIRTWRGQVLTWAGRLTEAEHEFNEILNAEKSDPDNWMGLATVYMRQGHTQKALQTADHAIDLDPNRADLRATRAEMLRAKADSNDARVESPRALALDPTSAAVRSAPPSIPGGGKEELRFGFDQDAFSFAPANRDQWVTLVSKWTPHWTTSAAASLYQRGGLNAGNFIGSITRSQPN
jgi:tetratricopeptide (TPR) repeat protein